MPIHQFILTIQEPQDFMNNEKDEFIDQQITLMV